MAVLALCVPILAVSLVQFFCFICLHFSAVVFDSQFIQQMMNIPTSNDSCWTRVMYIEQQLTLWVWMNVVKGSMNECKGLLSITRDVKLTGGEPLQK